MDLPDEASETDQRDFAGIKRRKNDLISGDGMAHKTPPNLLESS